MWTYLVIFVSISALLLVFLRRVIFVLRGKDIKKKEEKVEVKKEVVEEKVKVSRKDKSTVEGLCKRGEAMMKAGKDEEAIKCFVQALALDPNHKDSLNKLGVLYMHKQMYGAASALFKNLSEIEEDSVHYSHLGLALYHQNEYEEAKEAYQKAVSLDPSRPQRFVSLCQVYRAQENNDLALAALEKAVDLDPKNVECLFLMTDLLFETENFDKGKDVVRMILEVDPDNEEAKKLLRKRR